VGWGGGDVQGRARGNPRLSGAKERREGFRPAPVVAAVPSRSTTQREMSDKLKAKT